MIFSTFFIMNAVNHGGKRGSEVGGNSKLMRIPFISCHLLRRFVIICCCCKKSFKSLSDAQLVCCTKTWSKSACVQLRSFTQTYDICRCYSTLVSAEGCTEACLSPMLC